MEEQCWFEDICPVDGRKVCRYEMLVLGCMPCGKCREIDDEEEHHHEDWEYR